MTEQEFLTIGQVSQRTGLSIDTIRYYEKIGLLPEIERSASGLRQFSDRDIDILKFIHHFRAAGMPIERLKTYMTLLQEGEDTLPERLELLRAEREAMEKRLLELTTALERLNVKIDNYERTVGKWEKQLFTAEEKGQNNDANN